MTGEIRQNGRLRLACKPHSVGRVAQVYTNASSLSTSPGDHLSMQSTRDSEERAVPLSLLDLAPGGGCLAARIAANAGGLLHHRFTLTLAEAKAHCFCGPSDRSLHPGISPAPCPVEYGLSSIPWRRGATGPRSPDQPEAISSYTGGESASTPGPGPFSLSGGSSKTKQWT